MKPHLTVLIATHNRAASLTRALDQLAAQQVPAGVAFEALVVDNNSTDGTHAAVEAFARQTALPVRYLFEPRAGKVFALNRGIPAAEGGIVAFTDDDCDLEPSWLAALYGVFCDHAEVAAVGGRVLPRYPTGCPAWIRRHRRHLVGPIPLHDYGEATRPYDATMLPFLGANLAARREALLAVGLFNVERNYLAGAGGRQGGGEDTDLFRRLQSAGRAIVYCGAATVHHPVALEQCRLASIARWQINHGGNYAEEPKAGEGLIAGAPRWLYRQLAAAAAGAILHAFAPDKSLPAFLEACRCWGMFREYRRRRRVRDDAEEKQC
jgi:glycosyltransferase involved in cell wall biosynthesis